MSRDEITQQLTQIFRSVLDDDSIQLTASTSAADIDEWDSLNQIKIILACEHQFKVKLNARKINTLSNVGQMIDYLEEEISLSKK